MELQCECGNFRAELKSFPENTPGRLICYCDDCQAYLYHLNRADLLDDNAGTEVIPAYPADVKILSGIDQLKCTRLTSDGLFRFSTSCCNTPVVNVKPNFPWVGFLRRVYTVKDPNMLDQALGPIRSRVMGKFAKGSVPKGTADTFNLKAIASVLPFIFKGTILGKSKPSPFFSPDGQTPVVDAHVLGAEELKTARDLAGV